jgi:2-dehydropantoate 2-reductase
MRIAVIGAGGIGGYFGGRLAASGQDVVFVARGDHLAAIQRDGLSVASVAGDFTVAPARATHDTTDIGVVDVVMLCVKTWQVASATETLPPLLGQNTAVLTVQNGVEAPQQVAEAVGQPRVLPGIAKVFASIESPGVIRHQGGPGSLAFAEWNNRPSERVAAFRSALKDAGAIVVVPAEIWAELWAKFLFVVPFGTLGAAADATIGELRRDPHTRRLLEEGMREIQAVATATGVRLPEDVVETTMAFVDQQPERATSSLQRDLLSRSPSELDAWTGAVARLGLTAGVDTPVHRVLHGVLSLMAARSSGS